MDHISSLKFSNKKCAHMSTQLRQEGNDLFLEKHVDDTHIRVLELYSKCIAYAPNNSEELALGFGNRSFLLLHVKKYKESVSDTDRALLITKSPKLKKKLLLRKSLCLKSISDLTGNPQQTTESNKGVDKKLEIPDMITSMAVPCVSASLSLECNEKYGRHMVANQNIKPGEIIAIEEAYICFPLISKLYLICYHCLNQTWSSIPCNSCPVAIYCSESCKNQAWQEYHEVECCLIPTILSLHPDTLKSDIIIKCIAAVRFFIKITKNYSLENLIQDVKTSNLTTFDGTFFCNEFLSLYNMASNHKDSSKQKDFIFDKIFDICIKHLWKIEKIFTTREKLNFESEDAAVQFAKGLLIKFASIIEINSFESFTGQSVKIHKTSHESINNAAMRGLVFIPCCSFFNHSCVPNVGMIYGEKKKILFYSYQPIKKGEQLFISYFGGSNSLHIPKAKRQSNLKNMHDFICTCQACLENWLPPPDDVTNDDVNQNDIDLIIEIAIENAEFCKKENMDSIFLDPPTKWFYNENSMKQIINLIEIYYRKYKDYDAIVETDLFKNYIFKAFWNFYGKEWDNLSDCD